MPLVNLVGRSLVSVTVPTKNYFLYVVLRPAINALFAETSSPIPAPAAILDRGKGVAS